MTSRVFSQQPQSGDLHQGHLNADAFQCNLVRRSDVTVHLNIRSRFWKLMRRMIVRLDRCSQFVVRWIPIQKACSKVQGSEMKCLKSHFESQLRSCRSASLAYPSAYSHVTSPHVTLGIANWRLIRKRRRSKRGRKKQETAIIIVTEGRTSYRYVPTQTIWNLHNIIIALWDKPKFATYPPISVKKMSRSVEEKKHEVIIVGAGPVGLFLSLSLARKGVEVLVLEAQKEIIPSPRALM